jgi:hypothetical protein
MKNAALVGKGGNLSIVYTIPVDIFPISTLSRGVL